MAVDDDTQRAESGRRALVGREAELTFLRQTLDHASQGFASAVLVTGEPGVGKTALVTNALSHWLSPDRFQLVVRCLPLHALRPGLGPLRTAIQHAAASPAATRACLERFDGDPLRAMDDWIDEVTARASLALFVDDVQWADPSLRDVLLYLLTGVPERRLAVLVTARDPGLPEGHPLHAWMADVLRLPAADRLDLATLSRSATELQLAGLLGATPHQSLVDETYAASRGNPYLTSLLSRGLAATDRHLPTTYPRDLVAAVTGVWHDCSPPTRTLCCLLAVAGQPQSPSALAEVADELGLTIDHAAAVAEARGAGLLEQVRDGLLWFGHPLQAEVLEQSLPTPRQQAFHAAFARLADLPTGDGSAVDAESAARQAVRCDRAGLPDAAYGWAMRAWEQRGPAAGPELRKVLRRAIELRPQLADAAESLAELWQRQRTLTADAGAFLEELEAADALLELTDAKGQPLEVSELLVRRMLLRMVTATGFCSVEDMEHAVDLASVDATSWQYALALAELAHAASWQDDPRALRLARQALSLARATEHPTAISFALTAASMTALEADDAPTAQRLAAESADLAIAEGLWWAAVHAVMWETNAMPGRYGPEEVAHLATRRRQLTERGAPTTYVLQIVAVEADLILELGDAATCRRLLRDSLIADPGPMADLRGRLALARAAAYQGRGAEALAQIDRARELIAGPLRLPNLNLAVTWATALLEADRPAEAYEVALTAAGSEGVPVDLVERLVPLAARALADQLQRLPEDQRSASPLLGTVTGLRDRYPQVVSEYGVATELGRSHLLAMQSWYDAETARARRDAEESGRWLEMQEQCAASALPWLEAYACWRAAESLLARGHSGRAEGTRCLKAGYDLADRLGAAGIRSELAELARLARVVIATDAAPTTTEHPLLAELTAREREIVELLCTGRTYAEIAASLVISEKTVSSHVSNILRKTGTSSRVELTRQLGQLS